MSKIKLTVFSKLLKMPFNIVGIASLVSIFSPTSAFSLETLSDLLKYPMPIKMALCGNKLLIGTTKSTDLSIANSLSILDYDKKEYKETALNLEQPLNILSISCNNSEIYIGTKRKGLFYSDDLGRHFKLIGFSGSDINQILSTNNDIYVSVNSLELFVSHDKGQHFEHLYTPNPKPLYGFSDFAVSGTTFYLNFPSYDSPPLKISRDKGKTFYYKEFGLSSECGKPHLQFRKF